MKLIFATNNQHKIEEIQFAVGSAFELVTLAGAGIDIDIPEPHSECLSLQVLVWIFPNTLDFFQ